MGALAIKFYEMQRWDVQIDIVGLTAQELSLYSPRIEVRTHPHKTIALEYSTTLQINGTSIMWMILPDDTVGGCGEFKWQLMLQKTNDHTQVIKFPIDDFVVMSAIVQQQIP
jgi:hypothetical protein